MRPAAAMVCLLCLCVSLIVVKSYQFPLTDFLKEKFLRDFDDHCTAKYEFVRRYQEMLSTARNGTDPPRFFTFAFHVSNCPSGALFSMSEEDSPSLIDNRDPTQEQGLKNGGLGDRLAGIIASFTLALRFNRILVVQEYNGLHRLFKPYHRDDGRLPLLTSLPVFEHHMYI